MLYYRNHHYCFDIDEKTERILYKNARKLKESKEENEKELSKYKSLGGGLYWYSGSRDIVRNIAFVELEENTLETIKFKITEYKVNSDNNYTIENIKKKMHARYFVIDIKNKTFKIKNARREYIYSTNQGFYTMTDLFISKLFSIKSSIVVFKDGKCFEKILNNLRSERTLSYICEINDLIRKNNKSKGFGPKVVDILCDNMTCYSMYSMTSMFCEKISLLNYYIGNPGIEAIIKNDIFVNQIVTNFILKNEALPQGNLAEILGVSKTGLKTTNYIVKAFIDNISKTSMSVTSVNEMEIKKIISDNISSNVKKFDSFVQSVKGYNNVTDFIYKWTEEYFFQLYYLKLGYNDCYGYLNPQIKFTKTVQDVMEELSKAINEINSLITEHPVYSKNIPLLFEYATTLMRKQGLVSLNDGIKTLKDYVSMCKKMNAKYDKYPKNIKTSHDIVMMNYNFFQVSKLCLDTDGFNTAVSEYQYLEWNIKANKFAILTPSNYNELFIEGCSLDHCVSSYISKVIDKTSRILFVRKCEEIGNPYFTVEITEDVISHVKGIHQCDPDEEVRNFITKWANKNSLISNY